MKKALKIIGYLVLAFIVLCLFAIGALYAYNYYMLRGSVDFSE